MLRIPSDLPPDLEELIHTTIGHCITVYRTLGPGLLEKMYSRAIALEFSAAGIVFECEKHYPVLYRGQLLSHQRVDLVVAQQLVLEITSVEHLTPRDRAQVLNYMRIAKVRAGLLMNVNVPILRRWL